MIAVPFLTLDGPLTCNSRAVSVGTILNTRFSPKWRDGQLVLLRTRQWSYDTGPPEGEFLAMLWRAKVRIARMGDGKLHYGWGGLEVMERLQ